MQKEKLTNLSKIELINVSKSFNTGQGRIEIFNNLSLTIKSGEIVSVMGPNGCGKSTLLNLINGLDKEYTGYVQVTTTNNRKSAFAYMMQNDLLLPWRNVYNNIIIGLEIQGKINTHTKGQVKEYLRMFGILNLMNSFPNKLSGGERQKVAFIRTLIIEADILLLDEPFSAIDYPTRLELQAQIYAFIKQTNRTAILVTHDVDEAIVLSERVIIFNNRPWGIVKEIEIKLDDNSRNPLLARKDPHFGKYFDEIWQSLTNKNWI